MSLGAKYFHILINTVTGKGSLAQNIKLVCALSLYQCAHTNEREKKKILKDGDHSPTLCKCGTQFCKPDVHSLMIYIAVPQSSPTMENPNIFNRAFQIESEYRCSNNTVNKRANMYGFLNLKTFLKHPPPKVRSTRCIMQV